MSSIVSPLAVAPAAMIVKVVLADVEEKALAAAADELGAERPGMMTFA